MHAPLSFRSSTAAVALAVAAAACHPAPLGKGRNRGDRPVSVAARLVCPPQQGALTRTAAAADGRRCQYTGPDQRLVELSLLPLNGRSALQALQPVEATLRARLGATAAATAAADVDDEPDADDDVPARGARQTAVASRLHNHDHDHVSINLPGLHIEADGGGARVRALGETINARPHGGATVTGGWNGSTNAIEADDHGVEMRLGFVGRAAVDLTLLIDANPPRAADPTLVGYVARGPAAGPLVLATVVANPSGSHVRNDFDLKDVRALVAANLGASSLDSNRGR